VAQLSTLGSIERTYFMKTHKDSKGHIYADVENIRVTYIPASDRDASKDWAGSDVIRVQAYKAPAPDRSLHMGAEIPISSPEVFGEFVGAICQIYTEGRDAA
jgi:hypothetical protein